MHAPQILGNINCLAGIMEKPAEKTTDKCSVSVIFGLKSPRPKPTDILTKKKKRSSNFRSWFATRCSKLPGHIINSILAILNNDAFNTSIDQ